MQWVTLAVALGCVYLSQASHTPTPTPTSTHTPLVDNSEEEVDEPCFEPCTCEVKEGVLHVHCDGRSFTNASQVPFPPHSPGRARETAPHFKRVVITSY